MNESEDYKRGFNNGFEAGELNGKTLAEITIRKLQAEIEALQSVVNGNKEVMADWEAEVKAVREMNTLCLRSNRQQQAEIEALKADMRMLLKEYKQYWSDHQ